VILIEKILFLIRKNSKFFWAEISVSIQKEMKISTFQAAGHNKSRPPDIS